MGKNIGFISTRLAGIDGVSLEASKWADVLERNGHNCFWFAGELDKDPQKSFLIPEAHFSILTIVGSMSEFSGKIADSHTLPERFIV